MNHRGDLLMNDIVFSLDPGSVRTGWALMKPPEELMQAGLLLPDKQTDPSETRIGDMCHGLWQLLNFYLPGTIVIEWTSGKVGERHGSGGGAGLAVHGAAIGALWRECIAWFRYQPPENQLKTKVILVKENVWTRGVPKKVRVEAIAAMFSEYKIENDKGFDIADAIGLTVWYLRERAVRLVMEIED